MLGIMNDYEALFSKAPPPRPPQMPLVDRVGTAASKRSLLADHRYQLEFLFDNVGTGKAYSPIGRNQAASTAPKDPVVGPLNGDSPQISPIFAVNNNHFFNNVNFFNYGTTCEPISPVKINENVFLNQNQQPAFDFTPNFPPLYTSRDATLHQSSSSSSLNSIDCNANLSPIFESDSSNPVWQDRFLNINELLYPHAIDFGYHHALTLSSLDDDHVTSITPFDGDHVISQDQPVAVEEESLLSYYQNHVEILANQEAAAGLADETELIETTGSPPRHVIGDLFDQSQQRFKNQQEIFDEIYRECEQRVNRLSRDSTISDPNIGHNTIDQYDDDPFIGQTIIDLDLDEVQTITTPPLPVGFSSNVRKKRSRDPMSDADSPTTNKKSTTPKKMVGVANLNSAYLSIDDSTELSDESSFEFSSNFDEFGEIDVKKKKQNRRAASKYRTKRKIERINLESERSQLEEENRKWKSIVDDRQREIDYLKKFLSEIKASKAVKNGR